MLFYFRTKEAEVQNFICFPHREFHLFKHWQEKTSTKINSFPKHRANDHRYRVYYCNCRRT